jgi:hypothetical protein
MTQKLPPRIWLHIVDDHHQMMMLISCGEKRQETFHASKKGKVPLSTSTNNEKLKNVVWNHRLFLVHFFSFVFKGLQYVRYIHQHLFLLLSCLFCFFFLFFCFFFQNKYLLMENVWNGWDSTGEVMMAVWRHWSVSLFTPRRLHPVVPWRVVFFSSSLFTRKRPHCTEQYNKSHFCIVLFGAAQNYCRIYSKITI